ETRRGNANVGEGLGRGLEPHAPIYFDRRVAQQRVCALPGRRRRAEPGVPLGPYGQTSARSYSYGEAGRSTAGAETRGVTEEAGRHQHGARGQVELPASGGRKSAIPVGVLADGYLQEMAVVRIAELESVD